MTFLRPGFLFLVVASACSDPTSAGYERVTISVSELVGSESVTVAADCLTLPILAGSRVHERYGLAEGVTLRVTANNEELSFSCSGAAKGTPETVVVEGLGSESFVVTSVEGTSFIVAVQNGCL